MSLTYFFSFFLHILVSCSSCDSVLASNNSGFSSLSFVKSAAVILTISLACLMANSKASLAVIILSVVMFSAILYGICSYCSSMFMSDSLNDFFTPVPARILRYSASSSGSAASSMFSKPEMPLSLKTRPSASNELTN